MFDFFSDLLFAFLPWKLQLAILVGFVAIVAAVFGYVYLYGGT